MNMNALSHGIENSVKGERGLNPLPEINSGLLLLLGLWLALLVQSISAYTVAVFLTRQSNMVPESIITTLTVNVGCLTKMPESFIPTLTVIVGCLTKMPESFIPTLTVVVGCLTKMPESFIPTLTVVVGCLTKMPESFIPTLTVVVGSSLVILGSLVDITGLRFEL